MYSGHLDKVVDFLLDYPEFKLKISGHTDSSGDEVAGINLYLSKELMQFRDYIIILHPIGKRKEWVVQKVMETASQWLKNEEKRMMIED